MIGVSPLPTVIATGPQGPAGSDSGVLLWNAASSAGNASTNFVATYAATPGTTEYPSAHVIAATATLTKMRAECFSALASSNTITFTLRKNGVDTALTCTLGVGATSVNVTGSVSVSPGDILTMKAVQSGTGSSSSWGLVVAVSP